MAKAVSELPQDFLARLQNIDIVVEERPTLLQLRKAGLKPGQTLLGLYEGVPQTARGSHYGMVLPDKITIFQGPIESRSANGQKIMSEVRRVVKHEVAHHFGIGEARLRQIEHGEK